MTRLLMSAAAAALLLATPVLAQDTTTTTTPATPPAATTTTTGAETPQAVLDQMSKVTAARDFVTFAAMSDTFEVETGKLAQDQADAKDVKQLGKKLVKDHTKSSKHLMELAKKEKIEVTPPTELDQRHQAILDGLKAAKGKDFDTAFAQAQVQAHEEGIALFKSFSENGDNDQLKAFARKGLPVLEKHLAMAQKLSGGAVQTQ